MKKRMLSIILSITLSIAMVVPTFADEIVEEAIVVEDVEEGSEVVAETATEEGLVEDAADVAELTEIEDYVRSAGGLLAINLTEDASLVNKEVAVDADALLADGEFASANAGSAVYNNEWDRYSNNYVYNLLNANKKAAWDALDKVCLAALTGTANLSDGVGTVKSSAFSSQEDLYNFAMVFKYCNPQYYFLSNEASYGNENGQYFVCWSVYPAMQDGSARKTTTQKFKDSVAKFKAKITGSSDYEKIKSVTDVICANVVYDDAENTAGMPNELTVNSHYTQSAYSTFVNGLTVCAGYSLATELLLNDMGIDCMALTSSNHAWNKVRLNDVWYSVDNTWNDEGANASYTYFLKNDAEFSSSQNDQNESHVIEAIWKGLNPIGTATSASTAEEAVEPSAPTNTVEKPVITVNGSKVTIKTSTDGATVYYSTDGQNPSVSSTRCQVYGGEFTFSGSKSIKAIAVKDGYKDSEIASTEAKTDDTTPTPAAKTGTWKKDANGWWYQNADGSYPANQWAQIDGKYYHFNASGYMQTGWISDGGKWYYLESSGVKATSKWVGNYYLKSDGVMATNEWIGKYYVDGSGKWVPNKKTDDDSDSDTTTGSWKKDKTGWWYRYSNGTYPKNCWAKIDGKWYHFNASGYMQTGWVSTGGKWYYLNSNGSMATGWVKVGGAYYYLYSDGHMASNEWIGAYHVDKNGVWDDTDN